MKIRTQIVLAFLLLAVLPLAIIVVYSYVSSTRAMRIASEQQAALLAGQMDERMTTFKELFRYSVDRLGALSPETFAHLASENDPEKPAAAKRLIDNVGPVASLVESVEFVPAPDAPAPPGELPAPDPSAEPASRAVPAVPMVIDVEEIVRQARASMPTEEELARIQEQVRRAERDRAAAEEQQTVSGGRNESTPPAVPPPPAVDWKAQLEEIEGRRQRLESEITKRRAELEKRTVPKKIVVKREHADDMRVLFGHPVEASVVRDGAVVGKVRATVRTSDAVVDVLRRSPRRKGEVPFAVDSNGKVYTASPEDASRLKSIGLADPRRGSATVPGWAVARALDPDSGLTFGVARPFHDSLEQVRRTAGRNFVYGLALIGLALLGIVPVANHMARDVERVTAGAERIAHGDLDTEVPVTSRNEVGRLAATFNRMARDLKDHQRRLLEEERQRREREVEQRVLKTEYDRKSEELEQARRFQLSLLPKTLPRHDRFDIAVYMKTATEVGGDYYDFHLDDDGSLTAVVGDATGHGAAAGTMVTVVKSLFSAWSGHLDLRRFLSEAAITIKRMDLGRMAMALQIVRIVGDRLTIASAGMPPALVYRAAAGAVEEIALAGTPLGTLTFDYESSESSLKSGDVVLLMSDGFPELLSSSGEPLGYPRVEEVFASVARRRADEIIETLAAAAAEWSGSEVPNDDVTFVVVKMT